MNIERLIGLIFSIGLLLVVLFVFLTPQIDYQQEFKVEEIAISEKPIVKENINVPDIKEEMIEEEQSYSKNNNTSQINESDFDVFVMRVHVLSSEKNASDIVIKINEGGFPSFTEPFGVNKDLYAVYVGPFLTKNDITENLELIQKVSESKNGEVSRWKL